MLLFDIIELRNEGHTTHTTPLRFGKKEGIIMIINVMHILAYVGKEEGSTKMLRLPTDEETIRKTLEEIGCQNSSECIIAAAAFCAADTGDDTVMLFRPHKTDDVYELNKIAADVEKLDTEEAHTLAAYIEIYGESLEEIRYALDHMDDLIFYDGYTMEGLAEEFINEGVYGDIPKEALKYINYEKVADDLYDDYSETFYGVLATA